MKRIFLAGLMAIAFIAPSYAAIDNDDIQKPPRPIAIP